MGSGCRSCLHIDGERRVTDCLSTQTDLWHGGREWRTGGGRESVAQPWCRWEGGRGSPLMQWYKHNQLAGGGGEEGAGVSPVLARGDGGADSGAGGRVLAAHYHLQSDDSKQGALCVR